jgi:16S rRNA (adenine1518-N6/adenine1519-N6)-dimethyltransferase
MKAKKSLGQNFLKSKSAVADIIKAAAIIPSDTILEVGPGKGVLTEALLEKAGKVIAVEKDNELIEFLEQKFEHEIKAGKLSIIHQDILEFNPAHPTGRNPVSDTSFRPHEYKLVANIPYYITGQIFRKFLESGCQPAKMVLLVQKEVAERIVVRDGKESILSISVKAYGNPKYIAKVPARYFAPAPKVDSAILLVDSISKGFFIQNGLDEKAFFDIIKTGFAHKRKLLIRNLELLYPKEKLARAFDTLGISKTIRPEKMILENWKKLLQELSQ